MPPARSSAPSAERAWALCPAEWLFLGGVVLAWAAFVIWRGEDNAWDFRNYHWYIPYAFLHHRLGFDVAVAHQATFYNPFLDIPFYVLATHLHAWIALGILGAFQGANVIPVYLLGRSTFTIDRGRIVAAVLALLAMTGSLTLYLAGTTYYDNVMSVFVLGGLALIVARRETLGHGPLFRGALTACLAGLLVGSAAGLKLPDSTFALGFAAALAILPGDWRHRVSRLVAGGVGGIAGVALFAGYWFVRMAELTGNPLFPYFNQYFHAPLALAASYRDLRFIPTTWKLKLLFPLLFSLDWRVADDLPFHDVRVGIAYLLVLAALPVGLWWRLRRHRPNALAGGDPSGVALVAPDAALAIFAFAAVSYVAWLEMFAIYRYLLPIEILSPLLIAACIGLWPVAPAMRLAAAGAVLAATLALTRVDFDARAPVGDPYVQVTLPRIPHPDDTMILMTGETPMGFLVPSLPPRIPVLRIDGWMIQPNDGSELTAETKARVARFAGDLDVIFNSAEAVRNKEALAAYGLQIVPQDCRDIVTNLGGPYAFCPLKRIVEGAS